MNGCGCMRLGEVVNYYEYLMRYSTVMGDCSEVNSGRCCWPEKPDYRGGRTRYIYTNIHTKFPMAMNKSQKADFTTFRTWTNCLSRNNLWNGNQNVHVWTGGWMQIFTERAKEMLIHCVSLTWNTSRIVETLWLLGLVNLRTPHHSIGDLTLVRKIYRASEGI